MKLSVALCTYNGEKYIKKQLESIIFQSVCVDEIVVRDDGSSDSTLSIVKSIAEKHPEIRFDIKQNETNLGVVRNFENAIEACSGDIIFLSDQDDIWMVNKVESILKRFKQNPNAKVVFSNAHLIDNTGEYRLGKTGNTLFDLVGLSNFRITNEIIAELMLTQNRVTGATMAIKGKPLKFSNYQTYMLHDEIISLLALDECSLSCIKEPLIKYRIHSSQTAGIPELGFSRDFIAPFGGDLDRLTILPLSNQVIIRVLFRKKRVINYHSRLGWCRILLQTPQYIKLYKSYFLKYIMIIRN